MDKYTSEQIAGSSYGYIPNFAANMVGLVLFAVLLAFHTLFGIWYRQWWFGATWVLTMALEVVGYVGRIEGHSTLDDGFKMQLVCLIIAPVCMTAGIYYLLAKYIEIYGVRYSPLRPMDYSAVFISSDVVSLIVQAAGGGVAASGKRYPVDLVTRGGWVMFAGIAIQLVSLTVFTLLALYVVWNVRRETDHSNFSPHFTSIREKPLFAFYIPCMLVSILFIWIRSVYRLVELGEGWNSHLMKTERYVLVLDGLMILLGSIPYLIHPGFMLGKDVIPVEGLHTRPGHSIEELYESEKI